MSIRTTVLGALILTCAPVAQNRPTWRGPGVLIPAPQRHQSVRTEVTRVKARIVDGVCETSVAMTFKNNGSAIAEKTLLLPLPDGASADKLEMEIGGKLQAGEILDKQKARQIYQSIVSQRQDPALLEYVNRGVLRLRVFPIPPKGTQTVKVRFRMLLPESGGLYRWEFPTRAIEGGSFSVDVALESKKAVKNVYSPVQGMDVSRKDDHHARCSFESKGKPKRDPVVFYGLSDRDFGLNLITYRKKGKDGYFILMAAPKRDWKNEKELSKSITFVLDTSGSMQGEKIEQAKNALRFFLESLKPGDRFNVVPFSTEARPFAPAPVAVTPEKIADARKFADEIEARGGTNIAEALTTALAAKPAEGLVPMVVFLTDGLPTVGQTNPKEILAGCAKANTADARVFVFGVGHDVNTRLLDKLSGDSGGTRDYVRPGENLEVKVSALFEKLAHPVMTDVAIVCDQIKLHGAVPKRLPDMFRGSRIVIAGRYKGDGAVAVRLRGKVAGAAKEFVYDATFPAEASANDFVATLWAQRRIGQLLDAIRLNGQSKELVAEVRRIGKEHGIVTPYTSQLIVEEGQQLAQQLGQLRPGLLDLNAVERQRVAREYLGAGGVFFSDGDLSGDFRARTESFFLKLGAEDKKKAKGTAAKLGDIAGLTAGKRAVAASNEAGRLAGALALPQGGGGLIRSQRIAGKVFHLVGSVWVDSTYDTKLEKSLTKVRAFSKEYFELLRKHPKLAKVFAFSTRVIVAIGNGTAIEILPPAKPAPAVETPPVKKKTEKK